MNPLPAAHLPPDILTEIAWCVAGAWDLLNLCLAVSYLSNLGFSSHTLSPVSWDLCLADSSSIHVCGVQRACPLQ